MSKQGWLEMEILSNRIGMVVSVNAITSDLSVNATAVSGVTLPVVSVLLYTYHGSRFLIEQLESIGNQKHTNVHLWASNDGSDKETQDILKQYQSVWDAHFSIKRGPRKGFTANFLSLTYSSRIRTDYIAYADQDDIWEPDKLSGAIARLQSVPDGTPALYCSRTRLIDENGNEIGLSRLFSKKPSFANAVVQNVGGGNTMVMNRAAHELLRAAGRKFVVHHDWWAYMLISGAGGMVFYDPYPSVRYRQHGSNQIGGDTGWRSRIHRIKLLFKGHVREWNTINTEALLQVRHLLADENRRTLERFCAARNRHLLPRLWGVFRSGIYCQTLPGNLGLIVATLLKKI